MSKIGKAPVLLPQGVTFANEGHEVVVTGPKGTLKRKFSREVSFENKEDKILVSLKNPQKENLYGTSRALLNNMVKGVSEGWTKQLELVGTGYRAETDGKTLTLTVGFSHPVKIEAPEGISFKVEKSLITVDGADKEIVGQISANIRSVRPPEPYKGKGIKYVGEVIRRKAGKAAKVGGPGAPGGAQ